MIFRWIGFRGLPLTRLVRLVDHWSLLIIHCSFLIMRFPASRAFCGTHCQAFALFFPNESQCHVVSGFGFFTVGIRMIGLPWYSLMMGCVDLVSSSEGYLFPVSKHLSTGPLAESLETRWNY